MPFELPVVLYAANGLASNYTAGLENHLRCFVLRKIFWRYLHAGNKAVREDLLRLMMGDDTVCNHLISPTSMPQPQLTSLVVSNIHVLVELVKPYAISEYTVFRPRTVKR